MLQKINRVRMRAPPSLSSCCLAASLLLLFCSLLFLLLFSSRSSFLPPFVTENLPFYTDPESTENDELNVKIAEMNTDLLKQKADLIEEYFSIHIDKDGNLCRLPVVLDQYTPDMDRVPEFALCLANDVDWEEEKKCFQVISAALGNFYAMHPPMLPNPSGDGLQFYRKRKSFRNNEESLSCSTDGDDMMTEDEIEHELVAEAETAWAQREWSIQHVLFPSMRLFFKPPNSMATNGTFVRVASLEKLYRIFERC